MVKVWVLPSKPAAWTADLPLLSCSTC